MCVYSEPFPTAKLIQPERIIAVITRGLGVTCQTLSRNTITDNIAVGTLLPQIHVALFNLLDTLILLYVYLNERIVEANLIDFYFHT